MIKRQHQRGSVMILFGLAVLVLVGFVFVALDSGTGNLRQAQLQDSADSAALAGARALIIDLNDDGVLDAADNPAVIDRANAIFNSNLPTGLPRDRVVVEILIDRVANTVTVNATYNDVFGTVNEIEEVFVTATAELVILPTEIAFALDVSGSMTNTAGNQPLPAGGNEEERKINGLLSSLELFTETIFRFNPLARQNVYMSVIPYNARVNVGLNNSAIVSGGSDGCVFEDDVNPIDGFRTFQGITDPKLYCKPEAAPFTHIIQASGTLSSSINPVFGTCEGPDCFAQGYSSVDSSPAASLVNCPPRPILQPDVPPAPLPRIERCPSCECGSTCSCWTEPSPPNIATYGSAIIGGQSFVRPYVCYVRGRWNCPKQLQPLTVLSSRTLNQWTDVFIDKLRNLNEGPYSGLFLLNFRDQTPLDHNAAAVMVNNWNYQGPYGLTHINVGLNWAFRTLSPNYNFAGQSVAPSQYKTVDARGRRKIIVLLTDGFNEFENTLFTWLPTHVGSAYEGRSNPNRAQLDALTLATCQQARNRQIEIYTIGFDVASIAGTEDLLRACASSDLDYFNADNNAELRAAFREIADRLFSVRLIR